MILKEAAVRSNQKQYKTLLTAACFYLLCGCFKKKKEVTRKWPTEVHSNISHRHTDVMINAAGVKHK